MDTTSALDQLMVMVITVMEKAIQLSTKRPKMPLVGQLHTMTMMKTISGARMPEVKTPGAHTSAQLSSAQCGEISIL